VLRLLPQDGSGTADADRKEDDGSHMEGNGDEAAEVAQVEHGQRPLKAARQSVPLLPGIFSLRPWLSLIWVGMGGPCAACWEAAATWVGGLLGGGHGVLGRAGQGLLDEGLWMVLVDSQ
jgi:FAD/FMN-containing dehydrogenase